MESYFTACSAPRSSQVRFTRCHSVVRSSLPADVSIESFGKKIGSGWRYLCPLVADLRLNSAEPKKVSHKARRLAEAQCCRMTPSFSGSLPKKVRYAQITSALVTVGLQR